MKFILFALALIYLVDGVAKTNSNESNFVGYQTCTQCHAKQVNDWNTSQHKQAMQHATKKTVLGNFNQNKFENFGLTTKFYTKNNQFWVNTDDADGKLHDFQIKYTFGIYPLQQYLIEFPGGRLQALDIAWDARPKKMGGQRWFHLHPQEKIESDDVLHWTGPNLNWNYMCAFCHSTNLKKNYDSKNNTYQTSWSEINVSCEACHGAAGKHVEWAENAKSSRHKTEQNQTNYGLSNPLNIKNKSRWVFNEKTHKPSLSQPRDVQREIETCARCHSRRSQVDKDILHKSLFDAFRPALITPNLYYADGQIKDEVYVYGSFLQSKMHKAGVTCSDCHNVHSLELKSPDDQVCNQCHKTKNYRSETHHFHKENISCLNCHMPTTTFMGVDDRHDHSFRIPRPDLSNSILKTKTDIPNACNKCHQSKSPQWAEQALVGWYGKRPTGLQQFSTALFSEVKPNPDAARNLHALIRNNNQPVIARATALNRLKNFPSPSSLKIIRQELKNQNPMMRRAALEALISFDKRSQVVLAFPLIYDEIRSVRIEAANLLASTPEGQLTTEDKNQLKKVKQEYINSQLFNAERPETQTNLGGFYFETGEFSKSEIAFRKAITLQNKYATAYIGLSQLLDRMNNSHEAQKTLLTGLEELPRNADLHHALGLSYIRQKKLKRAIAELKTAAKIADDNIDYQYTYAIALNSTGASNEAINTLENINKKQPNNTKILIALVTINRDMKNYESAILHANSLRQLMPENRDIFHLINEIKKLSKQP